MDNEAFVSLQLKKGDYLWIMKSEKELIYWEIFGTVLEIQASWAL